jgi:hypothetical protein
MSCVLTVVPGLVEIVETSRDNKAKGGVLFSER